MRAAMRDLIFSELFLLYLSCILLSYVYIYCLLSFPNWNEFSGKTLLFNSSSARRRGSMCFPTIVLNQHDLAVITAVSASAFIHIRDLLDSEFTG